MSSLPTRSRATKQHTRKPYERPPPSPAPQLSRSKSSFFNTVKAIVSLPLGWFSATESAPTTGHKEGDRQLKRRASRNKQENGSQTKRLRTLSPPRIPAPSAGYLDPPEHLLRPTGSLGRQHKVTSDSEQLSVRNTPLNFATYHHPPRSPSRRTPSIGSWFPQPASTRNSLAPRPSQVHFGNPPSINVDTAIASYDDSRMQSRSPSVGVASSAGVPVGLGRERTPSKSIPAREASLSLAGRTSLSRATGSSLRASISAANPFSSLGKASSVAPERKKSTLVWDDTLGVTSVEEGKAKATSAPPAKNTAERLLNALENMHTHTGDAQRPRRRPPPSVSVPTPGPSVPDRLKRMIQPYGEVKVSPNKAKKTEVRPKSGLMKMLMKNKKEVRDDDMDMEEAPKPAEAPKEPAPAAPVAEKAKPAVKDVDTDMESQPAPAPTTTAGPALKVIDNFRPASQPPSRPGSSLRQSKTVTKRAHVPSAGRNRFSANNEEEEEDEEAVERRNAELLAVANANVFKVPEGFKFGSAPTTMLPATKPVELPKPEAKTEVIAPQPIPAKPTAVLSFTPLLSAPAKEATSSTPTFFSDKVGAKAALPEIKNPFATIGATKPEIKVPEVPKWGSAPSSSAPTPPPKPVEGGSPFANIGVPAKSADTASPFTFGKPASPEAKPAADKPVDNPFASIGKPADSPFAKVEKPKAVENPFANVGKPAGDNPFAGIGSSNKTAAPALPFSFGASKTESAPAASAPAAAPAASWFTKPAEAPKAAEPPKVEAPKPEPPKPVVEAPKPTPSPFSFGASQPAEKPAASPFAFGAPGVTPAATPSPAPAPAAAPAPTFSFGPSSVPIPTPAPSAAPTKPTFAFGLPTSTPSPAPTIEAPKKNPFDFSAPAAAPAPEAPKKSPFDFSTAAPAASTSATLAPTTSKSPFDFSSAPKPAESTSSPFTFGAPTPAPATAPAAATTEKKNPFDFSGATQKPASSPFAFGAPAASTTSTGNGFTFGAPAPARAATPPSGGDAAMEESPTRDPAPAKIVTSGFGSGFGSQAQPPSSSFAFGSNTNGTSTSGPFGGPLNGGSNTSNGFGSAAPASPSPFAFGAGNNATGGGFGSNGNGFGSNGSAAPSTQPFTFGAGGGFGQTPSATASPSNPFTQPTPGPFGQPSAAPSNSFPTPASPFPAASPALSTVGFNTGNSSNNAFGSTQPSNGFPASPATPAFAFGAPPSVGTASPSTFQFGLPSGTSAPPTPTGTTAPFVFGQGAPAAGGEGSPAPGVQFNLGTADASPGGRKIKPLRRPRRA